MYDLKDKDVLIVGLGRSGAAAARYCAQRKANVIVTDAKTADDLKEKIRELKDFDVEYKLGVDLNESLFENKKMVIVSPGVRLASPLLQNVKSRGVPVICEMDLALSEINVPVIGITGTNGKSTTTSLIGHLINSSGLKACVAGNIGIPLLDKIEEAKTADYVVLELSSFQLESIPSLKTKVAVWLNVTPDHLDWHKDLEEYAQAKAKIVKSVTNTGWCVYSLDDQIVMNHVEKFNCNKVGFSLKKKLKKGAYLDNEDIVICLSNGGVDKISLGNYSLVGLHNKENALASILTAKLIGLNSFDIERALKSFEGLKHRLQFVRDIDGVKYFNDSKGTNIGAVIMSLAGFDRDVVLILGGQSKNVSFKELRDHVKNKVKALILIGEAKDEIRSDLDGAAKMYNANDMAEAVKLSKEITSSGDTVLLSPACASFDMFKNYAHRGDVFVELVNGL